MNDLRMKGSKDLGITIKGINNFPGVRWKLKDRTARVSLQVSGSARTSAIDAYISWIQTRLNRSFGFTTQKFPNDWIIGNQEYGDLAVCLAAAFAAFQRLASQPCRFSQVLDANASSIEIAAPQFSEVVLAKSIELSIELMLLLNRHDEESMNIQIQDFNQRAEAFLVGGASLSRGSDEMMYFALAADRLGFPIVSTMTGFLELGHGSSRRRLDNSLFSTSCTAAQIASDKVSTYMLLDRAGIPVPKTVIINNESDLLKVKQILDWPLVVKPLDKSHKEGVTTDIYSESSLLAAFHDARKISHQSILAQEQAIGQEFRITVVGNSCVFARRLNRAIVVGNGHSNILELIIAANKNPLRGNHPGALCSEIKLGNTDLDHLTSQGFSLESVLDHGQVAEVTNSPGRSSGGITSIGSLHPSYLDLAKLSREVMNLDVVGVDLITLNPDKAWWETSSVVLECNPRPGLIQHNHADNNLDIHSVVLNHWFSALVNIRIGAMAGQVDSLQWLPIIYKEVQGRWPEDRRVGILENGICTLSGVAQRSSTPIERQTGQTLLAHPRCGGAILEWEPEALKRVGRPCERLDFAILGKDIHPIVLQEILDSSPPKIAVYRNPSCSVDILYDNCQNPPKIVHVNDCDILAHLVVDWLTIDNDSKPCLAT